MADKEKDFRGVQGVMEALLGGMDKVLSTKTVVGEATTIGDTIILPLVDVSFGVGAGAGTNDTKASSSGAGGMGGKMTPSAEYQEPGRCHKGIGYDSRFGGQVYQAQGKGRNV